MATAITTVTKKASVVKSTKGSEKKWSEILSMNRRQDLQLPISIAKYNSEFKRTYNCYQRQQNQTERTWAHKHETWYQDDFIFRNHLLTQLKPITQRFKYMNSISSQDNEDKKKENRILKKDESLALKKSSNKELPPLKQIKKGSTIQHLHDEPEQSKMVFSKLICPKILNKYEPRLYSHHHAPFLDVAQRFLNRKPEMIEKDIVYNDKQKQQKEYLQILIENEQERTRLAAVKFGQQLQDEKNQENDSNNSDSDDDDYYY